MWECALAFVNARQRCVSEVRVGRAGLRSTVVVVVAAVVIQKTSVGCDRRGEVRRARACRERIYGWWAVPRRIMVESGAVAVAWGVVVAVLRRWCRAVVAWWWW